MARNRCATVRMEEMYLRLSVEFDNLDFRDEIHNAIDEVKAETKIVPESVTQRNISETAGNVSIEFDVESENRDAGEFFEIVMKKLGIDKCE